MYFLNLKGFHPIKGINTDNHNKYPFLESTDGLFEPDDFEYNFNRSFPFEQIELSESRSIYVSEPNLLKVFKNTATVDNKILVNNVKPIEEAYTKELADIFYSGYDEGMANFYEEIGQTFLSLGLEQKKQALRDFITYCHTNLYFEGFAVPEVIYALGYIQASLVKGFQEYSNLKNLNEKEQASPVVNVYPVFKMPEPDVKPDYVFEASVEAAPKPSPPQITRPDADSHILLRYPASKIFDLWCALLDAQLCQLMQVPKVFNSEDEIKELLGRLFKLDDQEQMWSLSDSEYYYQMAPGYQNLLCLLMHATYKLNTTYLKVPQVKYCELLKSNFSSFETYESVGDIQRNMTKKKDTAIDFVHKSSGSYAKKAYKVLKKVPTYILRS
ncbi:hypothetical protein SAMN05192574_102432 [Mucilaginibacter gossypiicola]|uniref:Uncharacterized protein n=1 Tax=Mucilaginibacter gossypiicola TaxID=551995 RepID=A0A1H8DS25_9SPHI|nr:hypothetical protein [Mucilaginibacter gossypiicola]SEN09358.1 hypothetical protein SAMN05192574_102432 [Mucilaginibacter gossypiicola]